MKYNITNTDPGYPLYFYSDGQGQIPFEVLGVDMFSKVEIDDTEIPVSDLDNTEGKFRFDSAGDHIVKYTLKDPTFIGIEVDFSNYQVSKLGAAFMDCIFITEVIIPDSVTTIGFNAFDGCTNLTSVVVPNSATTIERGAFSGCHYLTQVNIPNSVTTLGELAFYDCYNLSSVMIPNSVTSIETNAFRDCINLSSITIEAITPPTLGNYVFDNTNNCPIYVPAESVETYKAAWIATEYVNRIQAIEGEPIK